MGSLIRTVFLEILLYWLRNQHSDEEEMKRKRTKAGKNNLLLKTISIYLDFNLKSNISKLKL